MAEASIDTLKISVEYDISKGDAAKNLKDIAKSLDKLNASNSNLNLTKTINALTKLSQINLGKVSRDLAKIKTSLQQVISIPKAELDNFDNKDIEKMQTTTIGGGTNVASVTSTWDENLAKTQQQLSSLKTNVDKTIPSINNLKNATEKVSTSTGKWSNILASFKRIAFYRIIRRLLQIVTQAIKEGIQNYAAFDEKFNDSMSQLASSWQYLKNALGTVIAPLIQMITPVIVKLVDIIVDLTNGLSELFAVINGEGTFNKATKATINYAKSIGKLKGELVGFDRLNKFGSDETPISAMFEKAEVTDRFTGIAKVLTQIKGLVEKIIGFVNDTVIPTIKPMLNNIVPMLDDAFSILGDIFDILEPVFSISWDIYSLIMQPIHLALKESLSNIKKITDGIKPYVSTYLEPIKEVVRQIVDLQKQILINNPLIQAYLKIMDMVCTDILSKVTAVMDKLDIIGKLKDVITSPALEPVITDPFSYFTKGLGSLAGGLIGNILPTSANSMNNNLMSMSDVVSNQSFGDIVIQIIDKNGNVTTEEVVSNLSRLNRRNGKTIIPVLVT